MPQILYYAHDPMCSWCWAFRPVWQQIREQLPASIAARRLLGGLAPDSDQPMAAEMQRFLQQTWRTIQQRVPGTEFNFDFWQECRPRRSTYPACRAVLAAKAQGIEFEEPMILAIQQAYYLQARNPSDDDTLIALAGEVGLDASLFAATLAAAGTQQALEAEILRGRQLGAQGFPSLLLCDADGGCKTLQYDYNDPRPVLDQLDI